MSKHIAIAIDGPAASGKSTLARGLAKQLGLTMVNSGDMYRAVTARVLKAGIVPSDSDAVVSLLDSIRLECGVEDGFSAILVDGCKPGRELRSEEVNRAVSAVAAVPEVRNRLVELQRSYLDFTDVVMEGRDIGTVVFPDTPYKIYVDADLAVRAGRRDADGEVDSVLKRDKADSSRATAPLKIAEGAAVLDTSKHDIDSAREAALGILKAQGLKID